MINFLYYVVHSVREIGKCSDFDVEWNKAENADWRLKDDAGKWDGKEIDCRVPSYQTAILDHLMTYVQCRHTPAHHKDALHCQHNARNVFVKLERASGHLCRGYRPPNCRSTS